MKREMICVACPVGCSISLELNGGNKVLSIAGNQCKRGEAYAITECTAPTRTLTTTAKVKGGYLTLVPVKSAKPIPKELMLECVQVINTAQVKAPVKIGDIIVVNILNTGVDIIATNNCPLA